MFKYKNLLIIILSMILLGCSNNVVERHQEVIKYESQNDDDKYNKTDIISAYKDYNRLFINYVKNNYKAGDKIKIILSKNDVTTEYDCIIKEFHFDEKLQPETLLIRYKYSGNEPTIEDYLQSELKYTYWESLFVLDVDEALSNMPTITINNKTLDIKDEALKEYIEKNKYAIIYDRKDIPFTECETMRSIYYTEGDSNSIENKHDDTYYFTYITDKKGLFLINENTIYDSINKYFYRENKDERDNDIKDITEFINNDKYIRFIETLNDKILKY